MCCNILLSGALISVQSLSKQGTVWRIIAATLFCFRKSVKLNMLVKL